MNWIELHFSLGTCSHTLVSKYDFRTKKCLTSKSTEINKNITVTMQSKAKQSLRKYKKTIQHKTSKYLSQSEKTKPLLSSSFSFPISSYLGPIKWACTDLFPFNRQSRGSPLEVLGKCEGGPIYRPTRREPLSFWRKSHGAWFENDCIPGGVQGPDGVWDHSGWAVP